MACQADCFRDGHEIRPIAHPRQLAWLYFQVQGMLEGTLELRQLTACPCGCDKLVANPPIAQQSGKRS